ncbi:leucine-rich repeat domain-containing protein [Paenibacillus dauci]|uniref:leucine-rich repeat domain-containing protein n=1 Tax=Paenibacillus dauci TaxID=1567106 RepID=UPI0006191F26|nr:leucine-rich repeat domain-containing protein [Paenibacillus dauci]
MYQKIHDHLVQIEHTLTLEEVQQLAASPDLRIIQCAEVLEPAAWKLLNEHLFPVRQDILLRLYGFYDSVCDLGVLEILPQLTRLSVECEGEFQHLDAVAALPKLVQLQLSLTQLTDLDILERIPLALEHLHIGRTQSRRPDLQVLARFQQLHHLHIEGHHKGIEVISQLSQLKQLTLQSITVSDLQFVQPLSNLDQLIIRLGGIRDLSALDNNQSIRYLELSQIKGLEDISVISSLTGLQYLFLQALPHIYALPSLSGLHYLRKVALENMKGLRDISTLEYAPALIEFTHREAWEMKVEAYEPLLRNPSLQRVYAKLKTPKKMQQLRQRMIYHNKKDALEEYEQGRTSWWDTFPVQ